MKAFDKWFKEEFEVMHLSGHGDRRLSFDIDDLRAAFNDASKQERERLEDLKVRKEKALKRLIEADVDRVVVDDVGEVTKCAHDSRMRNTSSRLDDPKWLGFCSACELADSLRDFLKLEAS